MVSFEGGEGAGKSTLIAALGKVLADRGTPVGTSREPGGTPSAERIRRLLLDDAAEPWSPMAEALLHTAARCEHVEGWVRPNLAAGRTVLLDRFVDSTRVYQGIVGGLGRAAIDRLQAIAFGGLEPDLTILLDLPAEVGLQRAAAAGGVNRYERLGLDFHERVRRAFRELAAAEPDRIRVIDATRPFDAVRHEAIGTIDRLLRAERPEPR